MAKKVNKNIRNLAIIAHVDHGKTTLVDAMLKQTGSFGQRENIDARVLDSNDLEKEKGITILAKNTTCLYKIPEDFQPREDFDGKIEDIISAPGDKVLLNIIDTPGHADFGGEVERGLNMADGVLLLVDSSEGPLPQTRFVLSKALKSNLPVILVINKTDRKDARIDEVVSETQDLLLSLAEDLETQGSDINTDTLFNLPILYASGKEGAASFDKPLDGSLPNKNTLDDLFKAVLQYIPPVVFDDEEPLKAWVTNLDSSDFLGRLAIVKVFSGILKKGSTVALYSAENEIKKFKIAEILKTKALTQYPSDSAEPGEIVSVAGCQDITIGQTITDPLNPQTLPLIQVDAPAISITFGANTSPLVGKSSAKFLTASLIKDRLDKEMVGNISIKVLPTDRPDAFEVQGRGELALAVLATEMRREGFELTCSAPKVVTKTIDSQLCEPYETLTINIMNDFMGPISELLASRKAVMKDMTNESNGWLKMIYSIPSRGLIGFRNQFLTITKGTGIANAISEGYKPWAGDILKSNNGSIVSDRSGKATTYAMIGLQERMQFFIQPGDEVYEGCVIGINSRQDDMDVNITREKKLTNMRSSTADSYEGLNTPKTLTLEEALEIAKADECVEITPESVRIRKIVLQKSLRSKKSS